MLAILVDPLTKKWCSHYLGLSLLLVVLTAQQHPQDLNAPDLMIVPDPLAGPTEATSVTLAWDPDPVSEGVGYVISYGTSSRQYTTRVDVGDTTTFVFARPDPKKVYFLAVQAYNTAGVRSPFSNEVSLSIVGRPLTATGLVSNAPAQVSVGDTITFTAAATGGTGPYQYKWLVSDGVTSTVGKNWSTSNNFAWTPTQPKPGYRMTVWVRNASSSIDSFDNPGAMLSLTVGVSPKPPLSERVVVQSSGPTSKGAAAPIDRMSNAGKALADVTAVKAAVSKPNKQARSSSTNAAVPLLALAPTITGVVPNSGSVKGGTTVTISGTNFVAGATVSFGGVPAATIVLVASSTSIVATTPSHAGGAVNVVVTNPDQQTGTYAGGFNYIARAGALRPRPPG